MDRIIQVSNFRIGANHRSVLNHFRQPRRRHILCWALRLKLATLLSKTASTSGTSFPKRRSIWCKDFQYYRDSPSKIHVQRSSAGRPRREDRVQQRERRRPRDGSASDLEGVGTMKANLYRMPKDPGHLGGYYLTPTIVGFLGLLLTNVTATQYIAHHFEYQPALGEPLFRSRWAALYEPFAWAYWTRLFHVPMLWARTAKHEKRTLCTCHRHNLFILS